MSTKPIFPEKNLISIFDLFKKSFNFLKENTKKLFSITLIALIPLLIFQIILASLLPQANGAEETAGIIIAIAFIMFLAIIVITLVSIFQQIALTYFINKKNNGENPSLKESYTAGKKYFFSYLWINILIFLIIIAGALGIMATAFISSIFKAIFVSKYIILIFITLSFILAMTIFIYLFYLSMSFIFSYLILICEDIKGFESIKKSKELVKNNWWNTAFKLITLNLIIFILSLASLLIKMIPLQTFSAVLGTFYSFILSLIILPFTAVYLYFIYRDLKKI